MTHIFCLYLKKKNIGRLAALMSDDADSDFHSFGTELTMTVFLIVPWLLLGIFSVTSRLRSLRYMLTEGVSNATWSSPTKHFAHEERTLR